eukprot:1539669-Rhodomonas_salina.3
MTPAEIVRVWVYADRSLPGLRSIRGHTPYEECGWLTWLPEGSAFAASFEQTRCQRQTSHSQCVVCQDGRYLAENDRQEFDHRQWILHGNGRVGNVDCFTVMIPLLRHLLCHALPRAHTPSLAFVFSHRNPTCLLSLFPALRELASSVSGNRNASASVGELVAEPLANCPPQRLLLVHPLLLPSRCCSSSVPRRARRALWRVADAGGGCGGARPGG